jgi:AcrR family transcriptional regulator
MCSLELDPMSSHTTLTRPQRRKLETRGRILAAAGELFAVHGYHVTSVEDICEQADISRQTFFNHFPSKGELLGVMVDQGNAFFQTVVDRACRVGRSTRERLHMVFEEVARATFHMGPRGHELVQASLHLAAEGGASRREACSVPRSIRKLVRKGRAAGDVDASHRIDDAVQLVFGTLSNLMSQWASGDGSVDEKSPANLAHLLANALGCPAIE